jgi:hypothetical protein
MGIQRNGIKLMKFFRVPLNVLVLTPGGTRNPRFGIKVLENIMKVQRESRGVA